MKQSRKEVSSELINVLERTIKRSLKDNERDATLRQILNGQYGIFSVELFSSRILSLSTEDIQDVVETYKKNLTLTQMADFLYSIKARSYV